MVAFVVSKVTGWPTVNSKFEYHIYDGPLIWTKNDYHIQLLSIVWLFSKYNQLNNIISISYFYQSYFIYNERWENATVPLPYAPPTNGYIHYLFASTTAHDDFEIGYEIIPDLFEVSL